MTLRRRSGPLKTGDRTKERGFSITKGRHHLNGYQALAYATRDRLMDRWFATQDGYYQADVKRVYYLSLEFLLGRLFRSNVLSLGAAPAYAEAMERIRRPGAGCSASHNRSASSHTFA